MNEPRNILGVDPGLRCFGYAVVSVVDESRPEDYKLVRLGALKTERAAKTLRVTGMNDRSRRARELARELLRLFTINRPRIICAKTLVITQSPSAYANTACAWGVLCALAAHGGIHVLEWTPQEIKQAVCKSVTASQYDVRSALCSEFDANKWLHLPDDAAEHGFDALGAIVAWRASLNRR